MKTFLVLLLFSLAFIHAQDQTPIAKGPRHWEIKIDQIIEGGCIAKGNFYDWPPESVIPLGDDTSGNIAVPWVQTKWVAEQRTIFIKGLGEGLVDDAAWEGMLQFAGTYRYTTVLGASKTVYAFTLSKANDPVKACWDKAAKAKPTTGSWMRDGTSKSSLDKKPSR